MKGVVHTALLVAFLLETTAFSESSQIHTSARDRQRQGESVLNKESLLQGYERAHSLSLSTCL